MTRKADTLRPFLRCAAVVLCSLALPLVVFALWDRALLAAPHTRTYPISGYKVGKMVASGEVDGGVLICGTGVGISLAANKVKGVRACVCSEPYSARLSKQHNNSNIIAFGARVIGVEMAKMIVDEWVNAKYEGGRHQVRVDMLTEIEQTQGLKAVDEQGQ